MERSDSGVEATEVRTPGTEVVWLLRWPDQTQAVVRFVTDDQASGLRPEVDAAGRAVVAVRPLPTDPAQRRLLAALDLRPALEELHQRARLPSTPDAGTTAAELPVGQRSTAPAGPAATARLLTAEVAAAPEPPAAPAAGDGGRPGDLAEVGAALEPPAVSAATAGDGGDGGRLGDPVTSADAQAADEAVEVARQRLGQAVAELSEATPEGAAAALASADEAAQRYQDAVLARERSLLARAEADRAEAATEFDPDRVGSASYRLDRAQEQLREVLAQDRDPAALGPARAAVYGARRDVAVAERAMRHADRGVAALGERIEATGQALEAASRSQPVAARPERVAGPPPGPDHVVARHLWNAVGSLETAWHRTAEAAQQEGAPADLTAVIEDLSGRVRTLGESTARYTAAMAAIQSPAQVVASAELLADLSQKIRAYNQRVRQALATYPQLGELLPDQPVGSRRLLAPRPGSEVGSFLAAVETADGGRWEPHPENRAALRDPYGPLLLDPLGGRYAAIHRPAQGKAAGSHAVTYSDDSLVLFTALYRALLVARGVTGTALAAELTGYATHLRGAAVGRDRFFHPPLATGVSLERMLGPDLHPTIARESEAARSEEPTELVRLREIYGDRLQVTDGPVAAMHLRALAAVPDRLLRRFARFLAATGGHIRLGTGFARYAGTGAREAFAAPWTGDSRYRNEWELVLLGETRYGRSEVVAGGDHLAEPGEPGAAYVLNNRTGPVDRLRVVEGVLPHELGHLLDRIGGYAYRGQSFLSESAAWREIFGQVQELPRHLLRDRLTQRPPGPRDTRPIELIAELASGFLLERSGIGEPLSVLLGVDKAPYPPTVRVAAGPELVVRVAGGEHTAAAGVVVTARPDGLQVTLADGRTVAAAPGESYPGVVVRQVNEATLVELDDRGDLPATIPGTQVTIDGQAVRVRAVDGTTTVAEVEGQVVVTAEEGPGVAEPVIALAADRTLLPPDPAGVFGGAGPRLDVTAEGAGSAVAADGSVEVTVSPAGEVVVTSRGNVTTTGVTAFQLLERVRAYFDAHLGRPVAGRLDWGYWAGQLDLRNPLSHLQHELAGQRNPDEAERVAPGDYDRTGWPPARGAESRRVDIRWRQAVSALRRARSGPDPLAAADAFAALHQAARDVEAYLATLAAAVAELPADRRFSAELAMGRASQQSQWPLLGEVTSPLGRDFPNLVQHGGDVLAAGLLVAVLREWVPADRPWSGLVGLLEPAGVGVPDGVSVGDVARLVAQAAGVMVDGESLADRIRFGLDRARRDLPPEQLTALESSRLRESLARLESAVARARAAGDPALVVAPLADLRADLRVLRGHGVDVLPVGPGPRAGVDR